MTKILTVIRWRISGRVVTAFFLFFLADSMFLEILRHQLESGRKFRVISSGPGWRRLHPSSTFFVSHQTVKLSFMLNQQKIYFWSCKMVVFVAENKLEYWECLLCDWLLDVIFQGKDVKKYLLHETHSFSQWSTKIKIMPDDFGIFY